MVPFLTRATGVALVEGAANVVADNTNNITDEYHMIKVEVTLTALRMPSTGAGN